MTDSRFAVYLIPPYPLTRNVAEIHYLLRKQFGFTAADRFSVHCTVKGFFKKNDRAAEDLGAELDTFFQNQKPLMVSAEDYLITPIGFGLSLLNLNSQPNVPFLDFRERVVDITRPYISDDCDFKDRDLGREFHPHITFAFRDIPNELYDIVLAWIENGPDLKGKFLAETYHYLEFFSEDWSGRWWETLTWRLLNSWHLQGERS